MLIILFDQLLCEISLHWSGSVLRCASRKCVCFSVSSICFPEEYRADYHTIALMFFFLLSQTNTSSFHFIWSECLSFSYAPFPGKFHSCFGLIKVVRLRSLMFFSFSSLKSDKSRADCLWLLISQIHVSSTSQCSPSSSSETSGGVQI